ncbi:hypothetical protein [Malonomonas rubra]|nr:hypothetical protein [Malonomonas rubra]
MMLDEPTSALDPQEEGPMPEVLVELPENYSKAMIFAGRGGTQKHFSVLI